MSAAASEDREVEREKLSRVPSYALILPALFLYFLLVFGLYPLTAQIHIQQVCRDLGEDDCESSNVSAHASTLNLITSFAYSIPSILTCGMYGSVADVYGRKIVMIVPFIGFMLYALAYLYVDSVDPPSYVAILVAGNFIMGLSGGYYTFIMSCMCYASDVTACVPHTRKMVYSVTEATIFVPQVFGPVLTGLWATYYGFFVPLLLGVVISAATVAYIGFVPESLPLDAASRHQPLKLSPLQTFTSIMFLFTFKFASQEENVNGNDYTPLLLGHTSERVMGEEVQEKNKNKIEEKWRAESETQSTSSPLPILCVSFFMYLMASLNQASVRIVYVIHRFGWNSSLIGLYDGAEGLVISLSMLFAPLVVQQLLGGKTRLQLVTWIQIGYTCRFLHWGLFGLMTETAGIFSLLPLLLLVGPLSPYIRTLVSNSVPPSQQAQAFAAYSALEGLSSLAGPVYSALYAVLVKRGCAWVIFELMAGAVLGALGLVTYVRCVPRLAQHLPERNDGHDNPQTDEDGTVKEDPLLLSLLESDGRVASQNRDGCVNRASRASAEDTTLLFCHLVHSQEEGAPPAAL